MLIIPWKLPSVENLQITESQFTTPSRSRNKSSCNRLHIMGPKSKKLRQPTLEIWGKWDLFIHLFHTLFLWALWGFLYVIPKLVTFLEQKSLNDNIKISFNVTTLMVWFWKSVIRGKLYFLQQHGSVKGKLTLFAI